MKTVFVQTLKGPISTEMSPFHHHSPCENVTGIKKDIKTSLSHRSILAGPVAKASTESSP